MPELKLWPILTRPASTAKKINGDEEAWDNGSELPTARARRRGRQLVKLSAKLKRRRLVDAQPPLETTVAMLQRRGARRRRWLQESLVIMKEWVYPEADFLEKWRVWRR